FVNEGVGGYGGGEHGVRKGRKYREESQYWTFVGEIGNKTVRLYPERKVYGGMVQSRIGAVGGSLINPMAMALDPTFQVHRVGNHWNRRAQMPEDRSVERRRC